MNGDFLLSAGVVLASFALSLILTIVARRILLERAMLDRPNERSSHKIPVPRGGGWAPVTVLIAGMLLAAAAQENPAAHAGPILGAMALALVSWLDDCRGAGVRLRLSMHIFAACLGSLAFPPQDMIFAGALPFWLDRTLMIVGWAWFMNLYNFMDGIDGITGVETVCLATGACILFSAAGMHDPFASMLALLMTGAALGFLALNWHPAKIFLGDVGSVPLGFLAGYLLLILATKGYGIPALILPLYYLADSGITLARRALRGEKVWQAHRQHFYQRAAQAVGRHDKVVIGILVANLGLIVAAAAAISYPAAGLAIAALLVAILLGTMHKAAKRPIS